MTYAIAISDKTNELLACEPDSPDDLRVRAAAEAFLAAGMRFDESYSVQNRLRLLAQQKGDGTIPATNWAEFALAFLSDDRRGWLTDESGNVYGGAIKADT